MARWKVSQITAVQTVSDGAPDDPDWYPLQHTLGIEMENPGAVKTRPPD